ncbi:hypothetical protein KPH14_006198 [Odynerus spinipes]|uniref:TOG domain-containing protein n=1 Tax=Odynerus spinipes TaxID=1348599 RepID=A0AAD9VMP8_9HYME|nr:hypothetical protein KPH14_006198 [Odynerus spinipes]
MTPLPPTGTPIQLTPLWEHVVRTRRFPSEIDIRSIFVEISERLRDPEWEVRQHALRVLMDVTPTLPAEIVDEVMQPVVPELINNLGHAAPAVRKGALDALRVYLIYSLDREEIVKNILRDGLTRRDNNRDNNPFQTNLITGVILSTPSLLFPSSNTPRPSKDIIKYVIYCLVSRLTQMEHQEATLKSLMKIRETIGHGEFDDILSGYDGELKKNLEVLCKVYNVKPSKKNQRKIPLDSKDVSKLENEGQVPGRVWDSDSDTSGIAEEDDEINGTLPPARVVLETEIKFNEETAITMTILEEKARNSCDDDDDGNESGTDVRNENEMTSERSITERRRTPRRVHFGGEIVKLRTPDSDDTESVVVASTKTRIPLPVSPATKMPSERRRSISQPNSPHFARRYTDRRTSRSLSSSPKREVYTHNAELSPKKGILTRTSSNQLFVIEPIERKEKRNDNNVENRDGKRGTSSEGLDEGIGSPSGQENSIKRDSVRDDRKLVRSMSVPIMIENSSASKESLNTKNRQEKVNSSAEDLSSVNKQADVSSSHKNITDTNVRSAAIDLTGKSLEKEPDREQPVNVASKIDGRVKGTVRAATTSGIKPINSEAAKVMRKVQSSKVIRRERDSRSLVVDNTKDLTNVADSNVITSSSRYNNNEEARKSRATRAKANEAIKNTKEDPPKSQEPSWEELGLVDREVLDDLHNKALVSLGVEPLGLG